jgi:hypothetical protein
MFKLLAIAAALVAAAPSVAAEFISNGNFETGTLGAWTLTGNAGVTSTAVYSQFGLGDPAYGNYLVGFNGGNLAPNGVLDQTISTGAGQAYTLSFDYGVTSGGAQSITASAIDATSFAVIATNTVFTTLSAPTTYSFSFNALSSGTIIRFNDVASNPTNGQDIAIDNVSVTGAAIGTVPEPASWALMIVGFGLVGSAVRRRSQAIAA